MKQKRHLHATELPAPTDNTTATLTGLALTPRNAKDVALRADQSAERAARDVLRECLTQIAANISVVLQSDDPEGPHQLRIGLRRLRSVFSVFRPVLRCREMQRLGDEARWLGQEVGNLRDLDVIAGDLVAREVQRHPEEPCFQALAERLQALAQEQREHLRQVLVDERVPRFLADVDRFIEQRGWLDPFDIGQTRRLAMPVRELARYALDKRWQKVLLHADRLASLTREERHELRKDLKKLRYPAEVFASLYPVKRTAPFLDTLKKLQTVFGDLNDAATLKTLFTETALSRAADMATQRAMGWMIGASLTQAESGWAGVMPVWQRLEQQRRFWRRR
ncbi:CHAD domain-containing protein [[Enterobacter] lignolyticus]|uniref:CHAD domain-containing protein n=1 Tax=[Enterobacter] lignolyticus TaxID=1334193 RepID=UPI0009007386|nr:CHAD domain-containing protein [[Enterobacter] lignolyticus]